MAMVTATGTVVAVVMGMTLAVEVVMLMGVTVVVGVGMRMLMGVGMTVMGMLMGMGMLVAVVMGPAQQIVMNMHSSRSFAFLHYYNNVMPGCQSIYFPYRTPSGACAGAEYAL
jgi:hypothetical protein